MAWSDGVDRATGYLVTSVNWNDLLGSAGSLMQLKAHAHGGTVGEGSQSLGPLVLADLTDAAAPAAPGAGKTRMYATSARLHQRAGAAGADQLVALLSDITRDVIANRPAAGTAGRLFASTDETPKTLYRDNGASWDAIGFVDPTTTRGDILVRTAAGLTRLAVGGNGTFLGSNGTDAAWSAVSADIANIVGVLRAVKTADETVNNSTVLQNDDHLAVTVVASARYAFRLVLHASDLDAPNPSGSFLKLAFTVPAGATGFYDVAHVGNSGTLTQTTITGTTTVLYSGNAFDDVLVIEGVLNVGGTGGTFQLQWAQNNAFAENTVVYAGSFMELERMS